MSPARTATAIVIALACTSGCVARSVADRGTGWWRVRTEHVVLHTDAESATAVTTAEALERVYDAITTAMPGCAEPPTWAPIEVTAFAHASDYDDVAPGGAAAILVGERAGLVAMPAMLVARSPADATGAAAIHGLGHRFVASCAPYAPAWVHEGLAQLFAAIRVQDGEARITAAPPPVAPRAGWTLGSDPETFYESDRVDPRSAFHAIQNLFSAPGNPIRDARFALARASAQLGMFGPSAARQRFARCLVDSSRCGEAFAWAAGTPEMAGVLAAQTLPGHAIAPETPPPIPSGMSPPEADLLWAMLLSRRPIELVRSEIAQHLTFAQDDDTTRARAQLLRVELGLLGPEESAADVLATLQAADPGSLDVLHARTRRELERPHRANEAMLVLATLAARADLRSADLAEAALLASRLRLEQRALDDASAAVRMAPDDWTARIALAHVLADVARPVEAQRETEVALNLRAHAAPDASIDAMTPPRERRGSRSTPARTQSGARAIVAVDPAALGAITRFSSVTRADVAASTIALRCTGRVARAPVLVLDVPAGAAPFVVRTEGASDTVLVLVDDASCVACDDDSGGGHDAAVLVESVSGRVRVYAGAFRADEADARYALIVERGRDLLDARIVPSECGVALPAHAIGVGMRVILGRHTALAPTDGAPADPIRDTNWVAPMDVFVGRAARVTGLAGDDEAGCPGVHVDIDGSTWFWRARDLEAPVATE